MSRLQTQASQDAQIRTASFALASIGIFTMALGFYMTGPRLVEFVTEYLSEDRQLSDATIAWLNTMHPNIIGFGVVIALAAILPRYVIRAVSPMAIWMETFVSMSVIRYLEKIGSAIGRLVSRMFDIASTEKCMWAYVAFVLLTLSIPAIFMAPIGGFHVEGVDLQ